MSKTMKEVMSKSTYAKNARKGKDMGKKGKNFSKIANKAAKEYGSKEAGEFREGKRVNFNGQQQAFIRIEDSEGNA